jgi:hypothetical protein
VKLNGVAGTGVALGAGDGVTATDGAAAEGATDWVAVVDGVGAYV